MKKKLLLFISLYISSLLFLLFQGGRTSMMIFVIINVLCLYLILIYWSGKKIISGHRTLNNVVGDEGNFVYVAGQTIEGKLSIDINLWFPPPFMLIDECLERHDGTLFHFGGLITTGFRGLTRFKYKFEHMPRGLYTFKPIECTSYDAFGFIKLNHAFNYETTIKVLPQKLSNEQWQNLFRGYIGEYSYITYNPFAKESNQQAGIREYHYGDKISKIHWNATARTGEWKSKDFEKESVPRAMVILDCFTDQHELGGLDTTFELAVSTAATLFEFGLKQHSAFGFISNSEQPFVSLPQLGELHYSEVMNYLTTVTTTNKLRLSHFLKQLTIERSFVGYLFIVTTELSDKMIASFLLLRRRGYEPYLFYIPSTHVSDDVESRLNVFRVQGFHVFEVPMTYIQPLSSLTGGAVG